MTKKTVELNAVTVDALKLYLHEQGVVPGTITGFIEMLLAQQIPMSFYERSAEDKPSPDSAPLTEADKRQMILDLASDRSSTHHDSQPLRVGPVQPYSPDFQPSSEPKEKIQPKEEGNVFLL